MNSGSILGFSLDLIDNFEFSVGFLFAFWYLVVINFVFVKIRLRLLCLLSKYVRFKIIWLISII